MSHNKGLIFILDNPRRNAGIFSVVNYGLRKKNMEKNDLGFLDALWSSELRARWEFLTVVPMKYSCKRISLLQYHSFISISSWENTLFCFLYFLHLYLTEIIISNSQNLPLLSRSDYIYLKSTDSQFYRTNAYVKEFIVFCFAWHFVGSMYQCHLAYVEKAGTTGASLDISPCTCNK